MPKYSHQSKINFQHLKKSISPGDASIETNNPDDTFNELEIEENKKFSRVNVFGVSERTYKSEIIYPNQYNDILSFILKDSNPNALSFVIEEIQEISFITPKVFADPYFKKVNNQIKYPSNPNNPSIYFKVLLSFRYNSGDQYEDGKFY